MGRPVSGSVVVDKRGELPVFSIRFPVDGKRRFVRLGTANEGWTEQKAEIELQNVLADVRRGLWRDPKEQPVVVEQPKDPSFHEFASQWFADNEGGWRPKTRADYQWQLSHHLLPFFEHHRLSQITIAEVDRYRAHKIRENKLAPPSVNKTIDRLAQILEVAVEYELIEKNPASGKRRKVKASKPAPVWLDRAEHIRALLDAAAELDRSARVDRRHIHREAMVATLVFAGPRLEELTHLRWRDVDLIANRIVIRKSKTDAGARTVDVLPVLRKILAMVPRRAPDAYVFGTSNGRPFGPANLRNRVLAPAIELANQRLIEAGDVPLPEGISPHKLRHTFASVLVALGVDPGSVMDQIGHTNASFTLSVYRHGMRRDEASKQALRELVGSEGFGSGSGSEVVYAQFGGRIAS